MEPNNQEHRLYRKLYVVSDEDKAVIQQYNKGHITKELAIRRLYQAGIQQPESYLRGCNWEYE